MYMIYMDNNATTPLRRDVLEKMTPFLTDRFGNASSAHDVGYEARMGLEWARRTIADCIGAMASEIVFTSGGTEANNLAIYGLMKGGGLSGLISTTIEHHSVINAVLHGIEPLIDSEHYRRSILGVGDKGRVDPGNFVGAFGIVPSPFLATVMLANNETGNMTGVPELIKAANDVGDPYRCVFHTDAVQVFGKRPISVKSLRVHAMTISAHKIGGPKGVGALFIREGTRFDPLIRGGHQENDRRAGTENVAGAVGFAAAAMLAHEEMDETRELYSQLWDRLAHGLTSKIPDVTLNSSSALNVGNCVNATFQGVDGEALALILNSRGICVSNGAACEAGTREPSHVLMGMGRTKEEASSAIRFSLGTQNTMDEVDLVIDEVAKTVAGMREG